MLSLGLPEDHLFVQSLAIQILAKLEDHHAVLSRVRYLASAQMPLGTL